MPVVVCQSRPRKYRVERTSMPMIGIRVTSWKMRHEANRNPPIIVVVVQVVRGLTAGRGCQAVNESL